MPFFGLGIHLVIAVFFAIHAVRTGQSLFWLLLLFSFPLLGSLVYFFAVWLPGSGWEHGTRKAMNAAGRLLDPTRELREAREAYEFTPTAQNRIRLAHALLDNGDAREAAEHYEACLKGPFANDLDIRTHAARAFVESGHFPEAVTHLEAIRREDPGYRAEPVQLLLARALAGARRTEDARACFEDAIVRFGSYESLAEYAIWALAAGDRARADRLQADIDRITRQWRPHHRQINRAITDRLATARKAA